ncbi:MAG TPA: NUDIX domain-containing protein [Acidimicrobiales bacterium]|nr:NUDIX domain-containing protein [Acidimicrobiales bacterium]
MPKRSAGLLLHRSGHGGGRQVLLVHPGGPFWAGKDDGAWSIPKGEVPATEDALAAAEREFAEELGQPPPPGERVALGEVVQAGGKHVIAWAVEGDLDVSTVDSNRFEMEWPPRSGRVQSFPEVDRAGWFDVTEAGRKLIGAQVELVERLVAVEP